MEVVNKNQLIELGYGKYQSEDIIRRAKKIMVNKGFAYYESRRLGLVPVEAVEEVLGFKIQHKEVKQHA